MLLDREGEIAARQNALALDAKHLVLLSLPRPLNAFERDLRDPSSAVQICGRRRRPLRLATIVDPVSTQQQRPTLWEAANLPALRLLAPPSPSALRQRADVVRLEVL